MLCDFIHYYAIFSMKLFILLLTFFQWSLNLSLAEKKSLHVSRLPSPPVLTEAWVQVDNPEFLLVRESLDKRSKRDPGYVAWTSVTNNMDVLRGHLKEKLFVEVARREGGDLGNIGKK